MAQMIKNLPAMQETWVQPLGWEDPLEKGMATHSNILACRTPWTEESGGLQYMDSQSPTKLKRLTPSLSKWKLKSLSLCSPTDYTVHEILQARTLEWVAFPFSRESSQPRDWTQVSHIPGGFFTTWATGEAQEYWSG